MARKNVELSLDDWVDLWDNLQLLNIHTSFLIWNRRKIREAIKEAIAALAALANKEEQ